MWNIHRQNLEIRCECLWIEDSKITEYQFENSHTLFSPCEHHTSFTLVRIAVITMSRNLSGAQFCHCKIPGTALSRDRSTCDTRPITNPACSEETSHQPLSFVKSLGHWAQRMVIEWWGNACYASYLLIRSQCQREAYRVSQKKLPTKFQERCWETRLELWIGF